MYTSYNLVYFGTLAVTRHVNLRMSDMREIGPGYCKKEIATYMCLVHETQNHMVI